MSILELTRNLKKNHPPGAGETGQIGLFLHDSRGKDAQNFYHKIRAPDLRTGQNIPPVYRTGTSASGPASVLLPPECAAVLTVPRSQFKEQQHAGQCQQRAENEKIFPAQTFHQIAGRGIAESTRHR